MSHNPIGRCIRDSLGAHYHSLDGENPLNIHDMVLQAIGRPLLRAMMEQTSNNQSQAIDYLGISCNMLRRRLQQHGLI